MPLFTISETETTFSSTALSQLKQPQFIWNAKEEHRANSLQSALEITLSWQVLFKERKTPSNLPSSFCLLSFVISFFSTSTNAITYHRRDNVRQTPGWQLPCWLIQRGLVAGCPITHILATNPPVGLQYHPKKKRVPSCQKMTLTSQCFKVIYCNHCMLYST